MTPLESKIDTAERLSRLPLTIIVVILLWWSMNQNAVLLKGHLERVEKTIERLTKAVETLVVRQNIQ